MKDKNLKKNMLKIIIIFILIINQYGCSLIATSALSSSAATLITATDRRSLSRQIDDRKIQILAIMKLYNNITNKAHINVSVFNHYVLLTGEAPSEYIKNKAEMIIKNIKNTNIIINEISVQPVSSLLSRSNDIYIATKVKAELALKNLALSNYFKIIGERGIIYIMGYVTYKEGNIASNIARNIKGVKKVIKVLEYIKEK